MPWFWLSFLCLLCDVGGNGDFSVDDDCACTVLLEREGWAEKNHFFAFFIVVVVVAGPQKSELAAHYRDQYSPSLIAWLVARIRFSNLLVISVGALEEKRSHLRKKTTWWDAYMPRASQTLFWRNNFPWTGNDPLNFWKLLVKNFSPICPASSLVLPIQLYVLKWW